MHLPHLRRPRHDPDPVILLTLGFAAAIVNPEASLHPQPAAEQPEKPEVAVNALAAPARITATLPENILDAKQAATIALDYPPATNKPGISTTTATRPKPPAPAATTAKHWDKPPTAAASGRVASRCLGMASAAGRRWRARCRGQGAVFLWGSPKGNVWALYAVSVATSSALMVCMRFSAWSKAMLAALAKMSSLISMPSRPCFW